MHTLTVVALHGDKPASANMRTNRQRTHKPAAVFLDHVHGPNNTSKAESLESTRPPSSGSSGRQAGNEARGTATSRSPQMICVSVYASVWNRESYSTLTLVPSHGRKPHHSRSGPTPQLVHTAMQDPCRRGGIMQVRSNDFKVAFTHHLDAGTPATSISCYRRPSLLSHVTTRCLEQPTAKTVESRTMDAIPGAFDAGDNGSGKMGANNIFIILATIAVGLRIVSRPMQRLALEAGDFLFLQLS